VTPEAMAVVLSRLRELGCTPDLTRDAAEGRIDPTLLLKWVGEWRAERDRLRMRWAKVRGDSNAGGG
jgi:hypothetical protein